MTNIYIIEENTWDIHNNIKVFSTLEGALSFCNQTYYKNSSCLDELTYCSHNSEHPAFYYTIVEYEVNE